MLSASRRSTNSIRAADDDRSIRIGLIHSPACFMEGQPLPLGLPAGWPDAQVSYACALMCLLVCPLVAHLFNPPTGTSSFMSVCVTKDQDSARQASVRLPTSLAAAHSP